MAAALLYMEYGPEGLLTDVSSIFPFERDGLMRHSAGFESFHAAVAKTKQHEGRPRLNKSGGIALLWIIVASRRRSKHTPKISGEYLRCPRADDYMRAVFVGRVQPHLCFRLLHQAQR